MEYVIFPLEPLEYCLTNDLQMPTTFMSTVLSLSFTTNRTGKIGGGADKLSGNQAASLERQQIAEFKKRYKSRASTTTGSRMPGSFSGRSDSRSELVLCLDGKGEVIGCAGVEGELRLLTGALYLILIRYSAQWFFSFSRQDKEIGWI